MPWSGRSWWWPVGSPQAGRPLLFLPPAGADQTVAAPLAPLLAGLRFGVHRPAGRGLRWDDEPPASRRDLAVAVADAVDALSGPPPVLVGHSFGSLVAFEAAQELDRRGRPPARLVVVAGTAPHAWADRLAALPPAQEYVPARVERLMRDGGVPQAVDADPRLRERARAALETDVRLSLDPVDTTPLSCPVTSVVARDDTLVDSDATALWHKASSVVVDEVVVPGDHFFYRRDPHVLAGILAGEVNQLDGGYWID